MNYLLQPGARLSGSIQVDGDKSISHRAVLLASLAQGTSEISGFLGGEDTLHTAALMRALGVQIEQLDATHLRVHGSGMRGLRAPRQALDCGNSGTGMRLLAGLLSAQPFASTLIGDASLSKRPMRRVLAPLQAMGAQIAGNEQGCAPLKITPAPRLRGILYRTPVASAQIKSCILLAGLYAEGETVVTEPEATRDHSERMLSAFGAELEVQGLSVKIRAAQQLHARAVQVPADPSSAAFFAVGAAICEGSEIVLPGVGVNPRRIGLYTTLAEMGAAISYENPRMLGGEPVADIRVKGQGLRGVLVPKPRVSDMIDEFPVFFIAAACATGISEVLGAEELRVKESDRIGGMVRGLRKLGIDAEERADGVRIEGGKLQGGELDSLGDHRLAMSFAIASLRAHAPLMVRDCANVATSFPNFQQLAVQAGLKLAIT